MQNCFDDAMGRSSDVSLFLAPRDKSRSTTHGGFDDDARTLESVVAFIKQGAA